MDIFNDDPVEMFLTDSEISDPKEEEEFFKSEEWINRASLAEITKEATQAVAQADEHVKIGEKHNKLATNKIWQAKGLVAILKLQTELERRFEAQKDS